MSNSYSTGSVTGERLIGGLVGENGKYQHESTVSNSYSTSSVSGNENVGGLVGENDHGGTVGDSYSTGSVSGNENVGGLVGHNYFGGTVSNSYFSGSVTGDVKVGGLMGYDEGGSVSDCYSSGSVSGNADVGGLVGLAGWNYYYETTVSNSFWDTETSGQATSDGGTGKTTAQMQEIVTFSGADWDIISVDNPSDRDTGYIWNIVDDETYPFLSWQS